MWLSIIMGLLLLGFAVYYINFTKPKKVKVLPEETEKILSEKVDFYRDLSSNEKLRFTERIRQFLSEVYIQGVGTKINNEDRILVAASAVIPVFGFEEFHYSTLNSVLIYPDAFNPEMQFSEKAKKRHIGGLVGTGRFEKQMIISRKSLHAGFAPTTLGLNTGIHEFVHLIDKMDGETDGVPEILMKRSYSIPWLKLIHSEIKKIEKGKSELRDYGAESETEFLAVAAEYFFEKPEKLEKEHPALYKALSQFFHPGN